MIYLKEANILFLKAKKVAGTSFEIALSKYAQPDDIITPITANDEVIRSELGFCGPQNYLKAAWELGPSDVYRMVRYREYQKKFNNHITAQNARKRLGADVFDKAHKVAIVRNPFDVLVSSYFYVMTRTQKTVPFPDWVRENPQYLNRNNRQYDIDGKNIIDYFIRFESLAEDTKALEQEKPELAGLADLLVSIKTKDGIRPKKNSTPAEIFAGDDDLISTVRFFNKGIFDRFDYGLN